MLKDRQFALVLFWFAKGYLKSDFNGNYIVGLVFRCGFLMGDRFLGEIKLDSFWLIVKLVDSWGGCSNSLG